MQISSSAADPLPPSPALYSSASRTGWLDLLRVLACFAVIVVHACDPYNLLSPPGEPPFWGALFGSLLRPCVPLFLMISGVLLLPVKLPMGEFYRKRFGRVFIPFIVWTALYAIVPALFGHPILLNNSGDYSWNTAAIALQNSLVNFYGETWHMWYMYVLLGIYLFLPVISPFIAQASKRQLQAFLAIWGVTLAFPYLRLFFPMILGEAPWNDQNMLAPFAGFTGFLVLAHYLVKYPISGGMSKRLLIAIPLFAIGFAITWAGFRHTFFHMENPASMFNGMLGAYGHPDALKARPDVLLERFWWYLSPNVVAMTLAAFIVIQKIEIRVPWLNAVISDLARLSFGIFLAHLFFVYNVHRWLAPFDLPPALGIPLNGIITFTISWAIVKTLSKLPVSRWFM